MTERTPPVKPLQALLLGLCLVAFSTTLRAQTVAPPVQPEPLALYTFRFVHAPLAQVLPTVQNLSGKTVVADPGLGHTFTLDSVEKVTAAEGLALIEAAFARQGLSLVEVDAGTLRVVLRPQDPS